MKISRSIKLKVLPLLVLMAPTQVFAQNYNPYNQNPYAVPQPQQAAPVMGTHGYYSAQNNFGVAPPPQPRQCTLTPTGAGSYIQRCW
jgi:hypothetical protein